MRLVIADTGLVNYLILIGYIDLLPSLFERVVLPSAVQKELSDPLGPPQVRRWIAIPPAWLEVHDSSGFPLPSGLDDGEAAAIALAEALAADSVDRRAEGLPRRGNGAFALPGHSASSTWLHRGLIDFARAIRALERTSFRRPAAVVDGLLAKHRKR